MISFDSDRGAYYAVLKRVNGTWPDCTPRPGYFLEGVAISLGRVKERVLLLSSDEHRKAAGGQVALSERQMKITRVHPCERVGEERGPDAVVRHLPPGCRQGTCPDDGARAHQG
jgi:hypothetical protein